MASGSYRVRIELTTPLTLKDPFRNVTSCTFVEKWLGFGGKFCYLFQGRISFNDSFTSWYTLQRSVQKKICMKGREKLKENLGPICGDKVGNKHLIAFT